jgi:F0F1-type ATP synthase membrane subunit b/b'
LETLTREVAAWTKRRNNQKKKINWKFTRDKADKKISDDLDQAKDSREKAEQLVEEKGQELKTSAEEIRKMKYASKRDAESQVTIIIKSANDQEKKILKDTEEQLKHEKEKVMEEIEDELTAMVSDLSAKFLSEKLDEKKDVNLIKKVISEREKK